MDSRYFNSFFFLKKKNFSLKILIVKMGEPSAVSVTIDNIDYNPPHSGEPITRIEISPEEKYTGVPCYL